jgi:hypothetical protein
MINKESLYIVWVIFELQDWNEQPTMKKIICAYVFFMLSIHAFAQNTPTPEAFTVIKKVQPEGPSITPYLQYQTAQAWRYDKVRENAFENIKDEKTLLSFQDQVRSNLLTMIGGLPKEKTPLNPNVTGKIQMNGFHIEKVIFESVPGFHVTGLVYVPENGNTKHPAVLVTCGHSPNGKIYYQPLCQRLVQRGYLVICWDPVGQGERSQFWDEANGKSRYNLVCGEHAVLGNFAYLAGANLIRWEVWDGMRAVDYLLTRPDVDPARISITGTSGGGVQAAHIGALDARIKIVAPSCYVSSLPMRAYNRIFADPDSDPEQDLVGTISNGIDHAGLLLLVYPRPLIIASAVLDFFPIEGTRKTFREVSALYTRFGHQQHIAMVEGYHKHQFSPENQEAVLNFMDRFNSMPVREGLAPAHEVEEAALKCTRKGQVLLDFPQGKNLMDLIREYFLDHQKINTSSVSSQYYDKSYPHINRWVVQEYDGKPAFDKISWQKKEHYQFQRIAIDQYVLRHSGGLQIPLLYFHGEKNTTNKTALWINLRGKTTQQQWSDISALVEKGENVISFDFRGTGETRMRYQATSSDDLHFDNADSTEAYFNPLSGVFANYVYNSILVGRPYFLQMIEDIEIVNRFARAYLNCDEIRIIATDETKLLATQITKTFPELKSDNNVSGTPWSQIILEKQERWPMQYLLPGGAYIR